MDQKSKSERVHFLATGENETTPGARNIIDEIIAATPPMIRIGHKWGAGPWFHADDRAFLQSVVDLQNKHHGNGTHWIETCPPTSPPSADHE